ncbi:MAG: 2-iminoacetate synthase ThiH [Kiritimatiellia bacterium]|nr:2-iminoacetate synthase ThiH [Kiritimatiellia bacterium]
MDKPHFIDLLREWPADRVRALLDRENNPASVRRALAQAGRFAPENVAALLGTAAQAQLDPLARAARLLTRRHFGRAVQFFVPLYTSNICCNGCRYCGFNCQSTGTLRKALTLDQAEAECDHLAKRGYGHLLLVASEDLKNNPPQYFVDLVRRIRPKFASINVEIYALTQAWYDRLAQVGVDGMTMFQETYDPDAYRRYHPFGPKADYANRLDAYERAARAGLTFIGLGALLGITDWRLECFWLALHADYLRRVWWKSPVSISFPRMRPAEGGTPPEYPVGDRAFVQLMCALRLQFPDATMTVSTREPAGFREQLLQIAATKLSAESKTTPGGYLEDDTPAGAQFDISDGRSLEEIEAVLRRMGFDPVLKDWDRALV